MKNTKLIASVGAAALALACIGSSAQATEGYFSHGFGAVNKSMAGAGVATGFDAMSQVTNPAALTLVDPQFTADLSIFSPRREHTVTGGGGGGFELNQGNFESDRNYFFIPSLAGAYEIDSDSKFGWAIYGNGGMNTTWKEPAGGVFFAGKTGVDLAQLFLQGSYARNLTPGLSFGIAPIIAAQRFKAQGLGSFAGFSSDANSLSDNGYDYSYGFGGRIGFQFEPTSGVRFGISYQSRMYMTEFDDYAGLFAEQGDFDIPPALQAGLSFEAMPGLVFAADWKRIWYGDIDSIANPMLPNLTSGPGNLGSDNGAGFGWETINAYKLGVSWAVTSDITLRGGVGFNDNPIPSSEVMFNILAPGVQEQHYTVGLGWQLDPNNTINFGAMFSPSNSVSGGNPLSPGQTIEIEMYQWEATVGWTWTF